MIGNKLAKTHVRIHGLDGFLISMDFRCNPGIVIDTLVELQSKLNGDTGE